MSDFDYEKMGESMARALKASGISGSTGTTGAVKAPDPKELDVFIQHLKQMNSQTKKWDSAFKKNINQIAGVSDQLDKLDAAIDAATDTYDREQLEAKKRSIIQTAASQVAVKETQAVASALKTASVSMVSGAANLTKQLLDNTSGVGFATGIMTTGLDIAGTASNQLAGSASSAGSALMMAGGKAKILGAGLMVASAALGVTSKASEILKFGVEILGKEVEKTVANFTALSSSGALYADGMSGMRNAAGDAGLSVEVFSKVVESNSKILADSGLGVAGGAGLMGQAIKAGGDQARTQLFNLGYTIEEQGALYAETLSSMRQAASGPFSATSQQVAEQTQKYATNLRIIAGITGEDAKAKMKQVQEQANQLAFQQKLARLDTVQRNNILAGMTNMSAIQSKNFMDMVNFGSVINTEGAVFQAQSAGMASAVNESYRNYLNGTMSDQTERDNAARNGAQINRDMLEATAVGLAGAANVGGIVQQLAEAMGEELQYRKQWTAEAIKNSEEAAKGQKVTDDALTKGVVDAQKAVLDFQIKLQQLMTVPMQSFGAVMSALLGEMNSAVESFNKAAIKMGAISGNTSTNSTDSSFFRAPTKGELAAVGTLLGGIAGAGGAGVATGGLAAPLGAVGGASIGYNIASAIGDYFNLKEGKAKGGIASGPSSGYLEKLHGTELVVPMTAQGGLKTNSVGYTEMLKAMQSTPEMSPTSAKTAGTVMTVNSAGSDLASLTNAMSALLDTARTQLDKQEEMIRVMTDNRDNTERLYHAMG